MAGTPGNEQVVLTWTESPAIVQIPVTDYIVQKSSDNGSTWSTVVDDISGSTGATVPGLNNGTAYKFRVAGVNSLGQGAWSSLSSSVTPIAGDQYFSSVVLLMHMDGSDGSTSFTDNSGSPKSITRYGSAAISTSQSKFGGASAFLNGWLGVPASSLSIGSDEDFTIECWAYVPSGIGEVFLWGMSGKDYVIVSSNGTYLYVNGDDDPQINVGPLSSVHNAWHHFALSRASGNMKIFIDGAVVGSQSESKTYFGQQSTLAIGSMSGGQNASSGFYMDELRVTKGIARYTGTFTPSEATFPNS